MERTRTTQSMWSRNDTVVLITLAFAALWFWTVSFIIFDDTDTQQTRSSFSVSFVSPGADVFGTRPLQDFDPLLFHYFMEHGAQFYTCTLFMDGAQLFVRKSSDGSYRYPIIYDDEKRVAYHCGTNS